ncbi:DUF3435 domain protein [Seiridium cupressi]
MSLNSHKRPREDPEEYIDEPSDSEDFDGAKLNTIPATFGSAAESKTPTENNDLIMIAAGNVQENNESSFITLRGSVEYPGHNPNHLPARCESTPHLLSDLNVETMLDYIGPALQSYTAQGDPGSIYPLNLTCDDSRTDAELDPNREKGAAAEGTSDQEYSVDCILERWKKNQFLLRWLIGGTTSWVARDDINDELVKNFEDEYKGFRKGIKVLHHRKVRHSIPGCQRLLMVAVRTVAGGWDEMSARSPE